MDDIRRISGTLRVPKRSNRKQISRAKLVQKLLDGFEEDPTAERLNELNEKKLNSAIRAAGAGLKKRKPIDTTCLVTKKITS